jgi:hypothetical protein
MSSKQTLLDIASFLDSGPSLMLNAPDRDGQRKILEAYLAVCYNELGAAPRLLDGDAMRTLLRENLPRHFKRKDPLAKSAPDVIEAFLEHTKSFANVPFAFEQSMGLQDASDDFLRAVAAGGDGLVPAKGRAPFEHGASKLGRNDPCSCGSGKKYKKCHGKKDQA